MTILLLLIPVTLAMGAVGLAAFFWAVKNNQFEDPDGDACRILQADDHPLLPHGRADRQETSG